MSGEEIMTAVGFFVGLISSMFGLYKYIEGKIRFVFTISDEKFSKADDRAAALEKDLAAHRLHTAETYVSKQGLRETKEEIMAAITGVHQAVENMTQRVDRIVEGRAGTRRP